MEIICMYQNRIDSRSLFLGFILYTSLVYGYSGNDPDTLQIFDSRDTIVVVADRFELSLKELAYTYHVIDNREIQLLSQHSALELIDVINPSAYILNKGLMGYGVGTAGAGSITIRGQGGRPNTGLLVLVNGHPDFMGLFGHPLPDMYGTDDIDQVEVLSGPASTVFGSQAMGGVINIKVEPDFTSPLKISAAAGSHTSYNFGINLARQIQDHGFFLTARRRGTDGHISKSSFKSLHLQTGWNYRFSPVWQISLQGRYVPYDFDDPSRNDANDKLGIYGKIRRGMASLTLKNNGEKVQGSMQIFGNLGHHRFYDGFESHDFTWGISTYQQWKINPELNLAAGGEFIRYGGKANFDKVLHQLNSFSIYTLGFYDLFQFLHLKAGFRFQQSSLDLSLVSPVLGVGIDLLENFNLYSNYQTGFRFPTVNELYLFPPSNPDLEEENIKSLEAGLIYSWLARNNIRFTVFSNDAENLIQTIPNPTPPPPVRYQNSGAARQWGWETEIHYLISRWLSIQGGFSHIDPDQATAYNPENQIKYMLNLNTGRFTVVLFGKYVEKLYAANNSRLALPDYHVLNLILSAVFNRTEINIQLSNILDRQYLAQPDYPAPGFHFMAGCKYSMF